MKRNLVFGLILILSLTLVSAGWFSDFFNGVTGDVVEPLCVDSDGIDVYVKGWCTDANGIYPDKCYDNDNTLVYEYICASDIDACATVGTKPCGEGYICEDGACVVSSEYSCSIDKTAVVSGEYVIKSCHLAGQVCENGECVGDITCPDMVKTCSSDGSWVFLGCSGSNPGTYENCELQDKVCQDGACVVSSEYSCSIDKTAVVSGEYVIKSCHLAGQVCENGECVGDITCPDMVKTCSSDGSWVFLGCSGSNPGTYENCELQDKVCQDGACVVVESDETAICVDSDGVNDIYIKGDITDKNGDSYLDSCHNPSSYVFSCEGPTCFLHQSSCGIDGLSYSDDPYNCPNGCKDGACIGEPTQECTDSDGGLDYYAKGEVSGLEKRIVNGSEVIEKSIRSDICVKDNQISPEGKEEGLFEYYCEDGFIEVTDRENIFECPNGCQDGACIFINDLAVGMCYDSDNGEDYYNQGLSYDHGEIQPSVDFCNGDVLVEYDCVEDPRPDIYEYRKTIKYNCPNGCKNGACLTPIYVEPEDDGESLEMPEDSNEAIYACNGCELNSRCYPLGYRKDGEYCSDDLNFTNQLDESLTCDNNFECKSNVCISGECLSEGLIKKILNWFKRVFS